MIMLQATKIFENETGRADEKSFVACSRLRSGFFFEDSPMKMIPLTKGKIALVDNADFEWLSRYKWRAHKMRNTYYAERQTSRKNSKRKIILMHREILKPPLGLDTDHKNGNGLDNQRSNLRIATKSQNHANSKKQRGSYTSKYKGVSWYKPYNKWRSQIQVKGKTIHLGYFDTEEETARVYDEAAAKYFGEFAHTNWAAGPPWHVAIPDPRPRELKTD